MLVFEGQAAAFAARKQPQNGFQNEPPLAKLMVLGIWENFWYNFNQFWTIWGSSLPESYAKGWPSQQNDTKNLPQDTKI